jgi:hypothetical protein
MTAWHKTDVAFCPWHFSRTSPDDIEIDITTLPGGGWAIGGMSAWLVRPGGSTALSPVSVPGASAARAGCATYGCSGYVSFHDSLVSVGIDEPMDPAAFTALLGRLLDGIG